jgi:hypothetical protein
MQLSIEPLIVPSELIFPEQREAIVKVAMAWRRAEQVREQTQMRTGVPLMDDATYLRSLLFALLDDANTSLSAQTIRHSGFAGRALA